MKAQQAVKRKGAEGTYCNAEDKALAGTVYVWTVITMILKETGHA